MAVLSEPKQSQQPAEADMPRHPCKWELYRETLSVLVLLFSQVLKLVYYAEERL